MSPSTTMKLNFGKGAGGVIFSGVWSLHITWSCWVTAHALEVQVALSSAAPLVAEMEACVSCDPVGQFLSVSASAPLAVRCSVPRVTLPRFSPGSISCHLRETSGLATSVKWDGRRSTSVIAMKSSLTRGHGHCHHQVWPLRSAREVGHCSHLIISWAGEGV